MRNINALIVDDEPLALDLLRTYLGKHQHINIVGACQNGRQAIAAVNEHAPDLIFLDIQMPGLSGFDVIRKLQADTMPLIVFITAYDEYALKAFDVHAVDYLLKPLDAKSLTRAIKRCEDRLAGATLIGGSKPAIIEAIADIDLQVGTPGKSQSASSSHIDQSTLGKGGLSKIMIKDRDAINLIDQHDIDWIDAAGDYMCIHVQGETYIMRSTLKALLAQLEPSLFQRVHRSTIVNLSRIEKITPCAKSEYFLELGNNEKIKVSRNYKTVIREIIAKLEGG